MNPPIEEVFRAEEPRLLALPHVVAVGLGEVDSEEAIVVFVDEKVPEAELRPEEVIPKTVGGYRTDVRRRVSVFPAS